jgi:hypothetical protein
MVTYVRVTSAIAAVMVLSACAGTGQNVKPDVGKSGAAVQNSTCPSQTASRIPPNDKNSNDRNCMAVGRSYSKDDIDRTGATTAADALQLLDPSITTNHR